MYKGTFRMSMEHGYGYRRYGGTQAEYSGEDKSSQTIWKKELMVINVAICHIFNVLQYHVKIFLYSRNYFYLFTTYDHFLEKVFNISTQGY